MRSKLLPACCAVGLLLLAGACSVPQSRTGTPPRDVPRTAPLEAGMPDPAAPDDAEEPAASLFFVIGPGVANEFEGSDSYQPIPFTVLRYTTGDYSIETEGLGGRIDVVPDDWDTGFGFGPSFSFRLARSDTDNAVLDALDSVDTAVELGGFVRYTAEPGWLNQDSWETRLTVNADVTGAHNGALAELDSDYAWFPERNIRLSVGARASLASDNFMDSYFGVSPGGSAASGLDQFDPSSGMRSVGAQTSALFLFSENHGVFALLRYDQLVGDAADSPIVTQEGSDSQWLFGLGYTYRF